MPRRSSAGLGGRVPATCPAPTDEVRPLVTYLGALGVGFAVLVNVPIVMPGWFPAIPSLAAEGISAAHWAWWLGLALGIISGLFLIRLLDMIRSSGTMKHWFFLADSILTRHDFSRMTDRFVRYLTRTRRIAPSPRRGTTGARSPLTYSWPIAFSVRPHDLHCRRDRESIRRFACGDSGMHPAGTDRGDGGLPGTLRVADLADDRHRPGLLGGIFWNYVASDLKHRVGGLVGEYEHPVAIIPAGASAAPGLSGAAARSSNLADDRAALEGWRSSPSIRRMFRATEARGNCDRWRRPEGGMVGRHSARPPRPGPGADRLRGPRADHHRHVGGYGRRRPLRRAEAAGLIGPPPGSGPAGAHDLATDCLSPIVRGFVCCDVAGLFSFNKTTRGTELGRSWPALNVPLTELKELEARGMIPSLVFRRCSSKTTAGF